MTTGRFPGHELKQRREELGLSRAEMYQRIKVAPEHIRALEEADLDAFTVPTFALGYLQTYCRFLGLDPGRFVLAFRACVDIPQVSARVSSVTRSTSTAATPERPPWMTETLTWAAVCFVVLLAWLTFSVVIRPMVDTPDGVDAGEESVQEQLEAPVHFDEDEF